MKKLLSFTLALVMMLSVSVTAFAATINQDSNPKTVDTEITTSIAPTYTVTIPADVNVSFNATSTSFGKIEVTAAQINPDKCIKVALTTDGTLNNTVDATKVIPYTVNAGATAFTSATYLVAGEKTDLTINITQNDWNSAYAGDYTDTVTFNVSYIDR
ncbi:MAG: hypothetical protein MR823_05535 [Ruminococcus sp.]|nr:hypothetical protein [Ruminococcus sp.]MDY4910075.1 hypothetical protein [Candidatus Fimenecus sp.]